MIDHDDADAPADSTPASPENERDEPGFSAFALDPRLLDAVAELGFETPTPIQQAAIPPMCAGGDLIASARTGSGKTAAFGLPLLSRLAEGDDGVRAVVLAPTRELCGQVAEALRTFAKGIRGLRIATIYGGAPYSPQIRALRDGCRVVVGTPGRVIDHIERGTLNMEALEVFVLDEADEMLQMGFIDEVDKILSATPPGRQIALFSATMPPPIKAIAKRYLDAPTTVQPESPRTSVNHVDQGYMVVPTHHKVAALYRFLCATERDATLVFARTRASCAEVADELNKRGLAVDALHGDLPQAARERVVGRLRSRRIDVVIATDVAARGLDIDHVSHVINLDLPMNAEVYVHRVGRTARAGREGTAISFVTDAQRGKMAGFARRLNADIPQLAVASDADIANHERGRIIDAVTDTAEGPDAAEQLYAEIAVRTGWDAEQVAVRALRQLAERARISLDPNPDRQPPPWARSKKHRRERQRGGGDDGVPRAELMIHAGRRDGARPADVLASLARGLNVPGDLIGRITIVATRTFVSLPVQELDRVLDEHDTMVVRGDDYRITRAQPRPEDREQRDGKPHKKKGFKGKKGKRKPGKRERDARKRPPRPFKAERKAAVRNKRDKGHTKKTR